MSIIVNDRINPTEGLVEYAKIVKPYHSKILDIDISYVFEEPINVEVIETLEWDINQYTSDLDLISTCGWGIEWDPIRTTMDYPSVYIRRAYGEVEVEIEIDVNTSNINIINNPTNYTFNVGDLVKFGYYNNLTVNIINIDEISNIVTVSGNITNIFNIGDIIYLDNIYLLFNEYKISYMTYDSNSNTTNIITVENIEYKSHVNIQYMLDFLSDMNDELLLETNNPNVDNSIHNQILSNINHRIDQCQQQLIDIRVGMLTSIGNLTEIMNQGIDSTSRLYKIDNIINDQLVLVDELTFNPIQFVDNGIGKIFISPYNNNQNSFLVDKETSPIFDCIVSDVDSNIFTFVNVFELISVDIMQRKFIVKGDIRSIVPIGMTIFLRGNTGLGTEQKFTVNSIPTITSGDTTIFVKEAISVKANNTGSICVALNEILRDLTLTVMGFDNINNTLTVSGDHLTELSTGLVIEYEDGLLQINYTILGTPTLDSNRNTVIKVYEQLDPFITSTGTIRLLQPPFQPWSEEIVNHVPNIPERFWPTPSWQSGTKLQLTSNINGLPYPLSDSEEYYFIPDKLMGRFKLAKTRYPFHRLDYIDVANYGIGTFSVKRSETFYPGATIQVTESNEIRNNRYYTIKHVIEEEVCGVIKDRIFVHQRIPDITTNIFDCNNIISDPSVNNDGKMSIVSTGWDYPSYCPNSQTDELYTDSLIQEDIVIEFEQEIQEINGNQLKVVGDFINSIKLNNGNNRTCPTGIKPGNPLYIKDLFGNIIQTLKIIDIDNIIETELEETMDMDPITHMPLLDGNGDPIIINSQPIDIIKTIFTVDQTISPTNVNDVMLTIVEYPQITPYQHQ